METNIKERNVTGIFNDRKSFEDAYNKTLQSGYKPEDINILMTEDTKKRHFSDKEFENVAIVKGDKSMEGLAIGGALGGTVVGVASAIAAIGTAVILPGLGLIVAGPVAAGLVGAGAGSIAGGFIGALIGLGIPEDQVKEYEKGLKSGKIVMGVRYKSDLDSETLANDWKKYNVDRTDF